MIDEGTLRERFPELPWDQPVPVTVTSTTKKLWACRYCIAIYGLRGQDLLSDEPVQGIFQWRKPALDHIEQVHHD